MENDAELTFKILQRYIRDVQVALDKTIDEAINGKYKDSDHSGALIALQALRRRLIDIKF